ncbi:MAG: vWA domain-containing protein [Gaiellaceae bacterium]
MPSAPDQVEELVRFGNALRREGIRAGTGAVADFCRAATLLPPRDLYWAGRATLVSRHEEIPVYDRVFKSFFALAPAPPRPPQRHVRLVVAGAEQADGDEQQGEGEAPSVALASRLELLRRKSFDRCTREELTEIAALAGDFARALPRRRSRRRRGGPDGPLDLPWTLRRSLRTGGEPFERRYRTRQQQQRRVVLLLDVSGSMSAYARALLVLAHAVLREHRQTSVLCFGTRLTDATRALSVRDPDEALRRAAAEVVDWEGGTRIGEALKEFLARSGHRGAARGAVVVVCSDGLDVGDPELLRAQMERLSRLAHRVVWLNPLKQDPAYEPLARGMAAALPFVDVFASGHSLESLEAVAVALSSRSRERSR